MITLETARAYLDQIRELIESTSNDRHEAPHMKGYDFERRFAVICESRGLSVFRGRGHFDYVVHGLRVQCKCLVPDLNGFVYVQPGSGPAYAPGSFDALAIETEERLHIIPEEDIPRTKKSGLLRAAMRVSFVTAYRDAWWVLERGERPAGFVRQLPLWSTDEEYEDGR